MCTYVCASLTTDWLEDTEDNLVMVASWPYSKLFWHSQECITTSRRGKMLSYTWWEFPVLAKAGKAVWRTGYVS